MLFAVFITGVLLEFVQEGVLPGGLYALFLVLLILYAGLHLAGEISGRRFIFAGAQLIIAAAFLAVSAGGLTQPQSGQGEAGFLQRYFSALSGVFSQQAPEGSMLPGILAAGGIAAAGALIFYLLILAVTSFPVLMRIAVLLADAAVILRAVWGIRTLKSVIAGAILFTLLEVQKLLKPSPDWKEKEIPKSAALRWALCLFALEAAVFFLPAPENPIDWSFVIRFGQRIAGGVADITSYTGYYLEGFGSGTASQSGYRGLENAVSPGSTLQGTDREELYITASGYAKNIYLAGAVYGQDDVADELRGRWYLDYLAAMYSHGITRETARLFGRRQSAEIEYGYIRTSDLIRPEKLLRIDGSVSDSLSQDGVSFTDVKRKGYRYDTAYLDIDYANSFLENILRTPAECEYPDYDEMQEYSRRLYDIQLNLTVTPLEYERWINEKTNLAPYLDVSQYESGDPETLQKMKDLAQKITAGAASDYDACRAVERYLRQYRYSVRSTAAGDEDYIGQFLFKTGEGYCVHFASSMVALLRLSGIPARYVEGYCYTYPEAKRAVFTVTGNSAHAWPEAYIEGFGWVPFEPTVIRMTSFDTAWGLRLPEDYGNAPDPDGAAPGFAPAAAQDVPAIPEEAMQAEDEEDAAAAVRQRRTDDFRRIARVLKYLALAAAAYFALMLATVPLIRKIRYERKNLAGKFAADYKDILWLLDKAEKRSGRNSDASGESEEPGKWEDAVPGEHLEITDPEELTERITGIWYRQRFAMRPATGQEVRDAGYLKSYLAKRYIGKNFTFFSRAVRYLLR